MTIRKSIMGRAVKTILSNGRGHRMENVAIVPSSCTFLKLIINVICNALRYTTFEYIWKCLVDTHKKLANHWSIHNNINRR